MKSILLVVALAFFAAYAYADAINAEKCNACMDAVNSGNEQLFSRRRDQQLSFEDVQPLNNHLADKLCNGDFNNCAFSRKSVYDLAKKTFGEHVVLSRSEGKRDSEPVVFNSKTVCQKLRHC